MDKKISDNSSALKPYQQEPMAGAGVFLPKTDFGKELLAIRNKALAEGLRLMSNDEILNEIEARRYGRLSQNHDC